MCNWLGTSYKYAGNSNKGIDCSGLVKKVFGKIFNLQLSGGSSDIYTLTIPIEKELLQEGDLVFFKIAKNRISHVGIYLSNNKFIHASVKLGVIISDLNEPYYKKYFYAAGRLP
jgi:lipoprotein Spr